jgi:hypothetical protein
MENAGGRKLKITIPFLSWGEAEFKESKEENRKENGTNRKILFVR